MANELMTLGELEQEIARLLVLACREVEALNMFIDGQMNWERHEFDSLS